MKSISVRVVTRGVTGTSADRKHNQRIGAQPANVNVELSVNNSIILALPSNSKIKAECLSRRINAYRLLENKENKREPKVLRKDAAITISGIITFSKQAQGTIDALSPKDQDERFKHAVSLVAKRLNTDIAGLVVHRDESAIHAHFTLYGYGKDGEPVGQKLQKKVLSELQDVAVAAFADIGIVRGKRISDRIADGEDFSKTIHRSVRELHRDLPLELAAAREKLNQLNEKIGKNEHLFTNALEKVAKCREELSTLEQNKADTSNEVKKLTDTIAKANKNASTYAERVNKAKKELGEVEDKLKSFKGNTHQLTQGIERFKTKTKDKTEIVKVKKGAFSTEKREMLDVKHIAPMIDTAFEYGKKYAFTNYNETLLAENAALKAQLDGINERHNAQIAELQARHKKEIAAVTSELRERINTLEGLVSSGASTKADHELEIKHLHAHVERLGDEIVEIMDYGSHYEKEANTGGLSPYFDSKTSDLAKIGIGAGALPQLGRRP